MIINTLQNTEQYNKHNQHFAKAFTFIKAGKFVPGRHPVDGENVVAIVFDEKSEKKQLEAHKKYIDVHYILKGTATMGWRELKKCKPAEYNEKDDYTLFPEKPERTMALPEGTFAIFFPEDTHCSMNAEEITKLVLKVKVS
jgi:YhcH/YjgK/YiaL family protein